MNRFILFLSITKLNDPCAKCYVRGRWGLVCSWYSDRLSASNNEVRLV